MLDRSDTNANQRCFDAYASMIKNDDRQYSERGKISSKKQKLKLKNRTKLLSLAVDLRVLLVNKPINKSISKRSDFVG